MIYDVTDFTVTSLDSLALLQWTTGFGNSNSTVNDRCKVTVQYSTEGYPKLVANIAPYVVRDLVQYQGTVNFLWHPNLKNNIRYYYTLYIYYYDTGYWKGPYTPSPGYSLPQKGIFDAFTHAKVSFSKLGTNTRISPLHEVVVDIIVWLPDGCSDRESSIEAVLNRIKPAHVKLNIKYERYYIAQTTTVQLSCATFHPGIYKVEKGTLMNQVATIDSSFSGNTEIIGG